jgi:hypothetical protein
MRNRTSTVIVVVVLGLAATPLAYHMLGGGGGSSSANWVRRLHGGSGSAGHGQSTSANPPSPAKSSPEPATDRAAQDSTSSQSGVAGTWTMTVSKSEGTSTMGLRLKQDGRKVTGTFASPHGEVPIDGEFADGKLTCTATLNEGGHAAQITLAAKLKDDGTLAGTMNSEMGEMAWTAKRTTEK